MIQGYICYVPGIQYFITEWSTYIQFTEWITYIT